MLENEKYSIFCFISRLIYFIFIFVVFITDNCLTNCFLAKQTAAVLKIFLCAVF